MYALRKRLNTLTPICTPSPRKEGGQNNVRKLIKYKLQQQTVRFVHFGPPSGVVTLYISFVTKRRRNKKGGNAYEEMKKRSWTLREKRSSVQQKCNIIWCVFFLSMAVNCSALFSEAAACLLSHFTAGEQLNTELGEWVCYPFFLLLFFIIACVCATRFAWTFVEFFFVRVCLQFFRDAAGQLQCFQISCTLCTDPAAITPLVGGNVNDVT